MKLISPSDKIIPIEVKQEEDMWQDRHLAIINDFVLHIMKLTTVEEVVWGIARQVIARMDFEDCVVYLYDKENDLLIQKAAHGPKNPKNMDIKNPIVIKMGEGIVGSVAKSKKSCMVHDTREDDRYLVDDQSRLSELTIPIIYENELLGVIDSEHSKANFYTEQDLKILETIAAVSANKIKHAQANEKLQSYQKNLEEEVASKTKNLQAAVDKLKRSNQDLESFAYAASHDLQEPLRTIISYIQFIKKKEQNLSPASKEYIEFVVDGAKRMKSLLQGLLEYSRLNHFEAEEMDLLNMQDLLLLIRANLNSSLDQHLGKIELGQLHSIKGNKTQIIQLFQNIISNGIKFTKADQNPLIKISSTLNEDNIEFRIKDNGIGIPEKFQDKIFSLFSRLNPIGTYEGSGIGLALCKRIMEYHQGSITFESTEGEGTTFILRFPKT